MNKNDMKKILEKNGIKENVVYEITDTNIGDLFGVEETIQGWSVYYSERGKKQILATFDNEDSACRAMLQKVSQRMMEDYGEEVDFQK
ncbi:hypothetical protein AiwAL_11730 [Acidiphilium sp. AL]|uniref:Uncharacterized protein n=1 Tax=Acidiphilium iwatense TaxID=768198 RepID=A0ABS9E1S5_9PROT|nr:MULTISPECIES: hypothetical protein [Acidiphilium]MCF3947607.1 hypothetical protein [Acidiphilium iwatense]MCU4160773.1 hypothetical protein [Acidiphilium sp. AL]